MTEKLNEFLDKLKAGDPTAILFAVIFSGIAIAVIEEVREHAT